MSLKTIIAAIGSFFEKLFNNTKESFLELPKDDQQNIIKGTNIGQIIKTGYQKGAEALISEVAKSVDVSDNVAQGVIDHVLKSLGINTTDVQSGLDKLADRIQDGITDDGWNGYWELAAKSAASWLSTGKLDWKTLSLGVVEYAFQHYIKGVK